MRKVWHMAYVDKDSGVFCEDCTNSSKEYKMYIDDYDDYIVHNPAIWCKECVIHYDFEIIGWLGSKSEYDNLRYEDKD